MTQATLLKKNCLKSKVNKQELAKQKEQAKQNLLLVLKIKQKRETSICMSHFNNSRGRD